MTPLPSSFMRNQAFWALWATQACGAFNDNFFRSAFVTFLTYHFLGISSEIKPLLVSAAFGFFMLPFFLFSPLAGQLAHHINKSKIIRTIKGIEVLIVSLSFYGFIFQNPFFLLGAIFCMGTHSAFFSPAKYAFLPELLSPDLLLKGNGYIEAGGFFAIMGGTLLGAFVAHQNFSPAVVCAQSFLVSLLGFCVSFFLPHGKSPTPLPKFQFSWLQDIKNLYPLIRQDPLIFQSILGIAWFWFVGSLLMAHLPSFAKDILILDEGVFILLLFIFTLGIGVGSLLCHGLFKGNITLTAAPLLACLMIPFLIDLSTFKTPFSHSETSLSEFLNQGGRSLRLMSDLFLLSLFGGTFVVPLYTFLQARVREDQLAQVIAFSNIVNAGAIVLVSVGSISLLSLGVTLPTLIAFTSLGQGLMTIYLGGGKLFIRCVRGFFS